MDDSKDEDLLFGDQLLNLAFIWHYWKFLCYESKIYKAPWNLGSQKFLLKKCHAWELLGPVFGVLHTFSCQL